MSVIVKRFNIYAGGKIYTPGEVISCLDENEEKRLVASGYCEYPVAATETQEVETESKTEGENVDPDSEDGPVTSMPLDSAATVQKGRSKK